MAGYAALVGYAVMAARAEPPPEIAKIRFVHKSRAEELLRFDGFMEVEYVEKEILIGATLFEAADIAIY